MFQYTDPSLTPSNEKANGNSPAISADTVEVIQIADGSNARLLHALNSVPSPYTDFNSHCNAASTAISALLSPLVIARIQTFHSSASAPGVCLITGLPRDSILPPTPSDGGQCLEKQSFVSEGCLTGISRLLGHPFGFSSEKNGQTIHDVCPVQHAEREQSNGSSKINLGLHVENAYFDERPDYLALYCLRQDHNKEALTSFADVRVALTAMDPKDVAELRKPIYVVPSPPSHHEAMGGEAWSGMRPVIESADNPNAVIHFPGMKALDHNAQQALDRFEQTICGHHALCHIALEPGNLLLINNRMVAHGRTCFEPRYDGSDRWLQRVYIRAGKGME